MTRTTSIKVLRRKLATAICVTASLAAFATLGDGGKRTTAGNPNLLSYKTPSSIHSFSLKSGYNYRGNNLLNSTAPRSVMLNTVVTYQKGNTTYILPLKKKVLLNKVKITPTPKSFR
jgi:hypothetical protein